MINTHRTDWAALTLRLSLGGMWIAHAMLKWLVFTLPGFANWLSSQGLSPLFAWPIFLMELFGGIAIVLGWHGHRISLLLIPVMAVAAWTHVPNGWTHTSPGGGWEYPVFLIAASLVHALLGDGRYGINAKAPVTKVA